MNDFTVEYEKEYGGPGSLDAMINVLGEKQQKVKYLVKQGGISRRRRRSTTPSRTRTPTQSRAFVRRHLPGGHGQGRGGVEASPEGKKWLEKHKDEGKSFRQYITSEFEGRDKSDIEIDITGAAKDPKEMLARKQAKLKYEKTAYGWAAGRSPEEIKQMKKMYPQFEESDTDIDLRNMEEEAALEQQVARLDKYEPGSEQYQVEYAQYERQTAYVDQRVETTATRSTSRQTAWR